MMKISRRWDEARFFKISPLLVRCLSVATATIDQTRYHSWVSLLVPAALPLPLRKAFGFPSIY